MSSSEPTEWLSFSGVPEEKITSFVQTLNRRAFEQGKAKDDEWLAQYAAACLSEDALIWYYSLGEEVRDSWKKLCPALLKEFSNKPAATRAEVMESDIVPAPAPGSAPSWAPIPAAAQAPAASPAPARPPVPSQRQSSTVRVGNIEAVDASSGDRLGYLNSKGDKTLTQDINNAVLVELPLTATASTPVSLRMINAVVNDPQSSYAGIMGLEDPLNWWMLVACVPGNKERHLPGALTTMTMSYIWTVHRLGETLELKILNPGRFTWERPTRLYVGQYLPIDTIAKGFINSNPKPSSDDMLCAYDKEDVEGLPGFRKARMIFRPI